MRLLFVLLLFIPVLAFGQNATRRALKQHPKTIDDALGQLHFLFADSVKQRVKNMPEDQFVAYTHLSAGMWIRNEWLYDRTLKVKESKLRRELQERGLPTNDDMSAFLLRSFHRQLNDLPPDMDQQVREVHQWYLNMSDPAWRKHREDSLFSSYMANFHIGDTLINHIYYKRDLLGAPRRNTLLESIVVDKTDSLLQIAIVRYGQERNTKLVHKYIGCDGPVCWVNARAWSFDWKKKQPQEAKK